jgi:hypothetical protein
MNTRRFDVFCAGVSYLLAGNSFLGFVMLCLSAFRHYSWSWLWYIAPAEVILATLWVACVLVLQRLYNPDGSTRSA